MVKKCGLSGLFSKCFMLCVSEGKTLKLYTIKLIMTNMNMILYITNQSPVFEYSES